jgi:hypothetical protein
MQHRRDAPPHGVALSLPAALYSIFAEPLMRGGMAADENFPLEKGGTSAAIISFSICTGRVTRAFQHHPADQIAHSNVPQPPDAIGEVAMTQGNARSAVKTGSLNTHNVLSWLFISCTLLMLMSVIRMWSHWLEISASLGFYPAAGALAAVTGAALNLSWWLNTGNE